MLPDNIVDIVKNGGELYAFRNGIAVKKQKEVVGNLKQRIDALKIIHKSNSLSQKLFQEKIIVVLQYAEKYTSGSHFLIIINRSMLTHYVKEIWNEFYMKNHSLREMPLEKSENPPNSNNTTNTKTGDIPSPAQDKNNKIDKKDKNDRTIFSPEIMHSIKRIGLLVFVGILLGGLLFFILTTLKVSEIVSIVLSLIASIIGPTLPDLFKKYFNSTTNEEKQSNKHER